MFYEVLIRIVKFIVRVVNGPIHFEYHPDYDPTKRYLVVSPHRSLLDPVMIGFGVMPKQIAFMAKEELFEHKLLGWLLPKINVFPVNRDKPSAATLKMAARILKDNDKHLGMFPTGSRYETAIKPGAATLAKMGNADILPVVYQGPIKLKDLFSWKKANRVNIRVGQPIALPDKKRLDKADYDELEKQIGQALIETDRALNPDFFYDIDKAIAERDAKRQQKALK